MLGAAPIALLIAWRRGWLRLEGLPGRTGGLTPAESLAFILALVASASLGSAAVAGWAGESPDADAAPAQAIRHHAVLYLGAYAAQLLPAGVLAWLWRRRRTAAPRLSAGAAALSGALSLALAWPLVQASSVLLSLLVEAVSGRAPEPIAHETLERLARGEGGAWLALLVTEVTLGAAVMEEVLYRGLVQEALVRLHFGRWPAIAAASLFFTAMHVGAVPGGRASTLLILLPSLFILSLALGWIYERTGRLIAPVALHLLFNIVNIVLAWTTV